MVYTSLDNPKIKEIKKLHQKKYRDKTNLFLVEGEHLVLEAYKTGYLKDLILESDAVLPLDVNTLYVSNNVLVGLSTLETPYQVMGVCRKLEEKETLGNHILVLDGIQDPGNLGTIIRSAVAFHIDTIILSHDSVDLYNSKVVRSTQGLLFHQNILRRNLEEILPKLKEDGYVLYGTKVTHGTSLKRVAKKEKFVIIMGNEGNGIKNTTEEICDEFLYIDMNTVCESLNVGVATSIILYELDK
jgi:TrmH family RNA methyltransferase